MSTYAEQPFTEFEERYFLAEILKKSPLPPGAILDVIHKAGFEPAWTEIALPNGRSLSACQQAYNNLSNRSGLLPSTSISDASRRGGKRPYSSLGGETSTTLPRELQPRPPTFTTVNGQQVPVPTPAVMSPVEPQRKKRGRPTKSEFERRQAEARERGEIWPKPRKQKPRPSTEGSEVAAGSIAGGQPTSVVSEGEGPGESSGTTSGPLPPVSGGTAPTATMYSPTETDIGARQSLSGPPLGLLHSQEQRSRGIPSSEAQMQDVPAYNPTAEVPRQYGHMISPQEAQRAPDPRGTVMSNYNSPQQRQYGYHPDKSRQGQLGQQQQQGPR